MSGPFFAGLGAAGMFLVVYAGVLAFFLERIKNGEAS